MADVNDLLELATARAIDLAKAASREPRGLDPDLQALSRTLDEAAAALDNEGAQRRAQARDTIETAVEAVYAELARVGFM